MGGICWRHFFCSVGVFFPQRLKERSEGGVLWAGLEQSFPSLLEGACMSVGVHTCVCLYFHMCVWLDEGAGGTV